MAVFLIENIPDEGNPQQPMEEMLVWNVAFATYAHQLWYK